MAMTRIDPIPALNHQPGAALPPIITGWHRDEIGYVVKADGSRIAELRREKLDRFSLETLIRFLTRLGWRVEIKSLRRRRARDISDGRGDRRRSTAGSDAHNFWTPLAPS